MTGVPNNDQRSPTSFKPSNSIPVSDQSQPCFIEAQKIDYEVISTKAKDDEYLRNIQRTPDLILDLSLKGNDFEEDYDPKLGLIDRIHVNNTQNSDKSTPLANNEGEPRVFSCNYCQRKFYSSQALGGHQNAHKRERTLAKRGQQMASTPFGNYLPQHFYKNRPLTTPSSYHPSNISGLPLYGLHYKYNHNYNHRPLGIQAHSLIHKPSHGGAGRMPMIDQQQAIGRLAIRSPSSSSSNGRVARFDSVHQKNSQQLDRNIGGVCWKDSVNVLKSSLIKNDRDHLHKLDLSLRL